MLSNESHVPQTDSMTIDRLWADVAAHKSRAPHSLPSRSPSSPKGERNKPSDKPPERDDSDVKTSDGTMYATSSCEELTGLDADPLVPNSTQIDRAFAQGRETWTHLIEKARSMPDHSIPSALADPSIMLEHAPALPRSLPSAEFIEGYCMWLVSSEGNSSFSERKAGPKKHFTISHESPIKCLLLSQAQTSNFKSPIAASEWLPVFTLCWSYILSAKLLELQNRHLQYSTLYLRPRPQVAEAKPSEVVLHLGTSPSPRLVRWLCALLSPGQGFTTEDEEGFAPWAAFCTGDVQFVITIDNLAAFDPAALIPNHSEATELLIELCFRLNIAPKQHAETAETLSPCMAGFLAALALPFYRMENLEPQFHMPPLAERHSKAEGESQLESIKSIVSDIRYYMTLSMHPTSVASAIWSIFWEPKIECDVVSPWLGSILTVLSPLLETKNVDILGRAFALHRPRVASWWLGIFLLGNKSILDQITRYLRTLEERYGYGSLAAPDITTAAWTGSAQSFLDQEEVHIPDDDVISRANLLYLRHSFRLQCSAGPLLSWRPFGNISRRNIEPELLPYLGLTHIRKYQHWVWEKPGRRDGFNSDGVQKGFREDTGRFVEQIEPNLFVLHRSVGENLGRINLAPSKRATLRMLNYCMVEISGDRHRDNAGIPRLNDHPWLEGWRG
jgi:hypothetical protein